VEAIAEVATPSVAVVALVVVILDRIFTFVKHQRGNDSDALISLMARQTSELHTWHAREDEEGVKIWYVRRSLEKAVLELSTNTVAQTELLRELVREVQGDRSDLADLRDELKQRSQNGAKR
jgi:hypothetical protein